MGDKGIKPVLCNMLPQVKYIPRGGTKQLAQLHFLLITTLSYHSGVSPHPKQTTTARCRVKNSPWRKESPSRPSRLHYSQYMSLAPVLKLLIKAAHSGPRMGVPPTPSEISSTFTSGGSECNDTSPVSGSSLQTHERFLAL